MDSRYRIPPGSPLDRALNVLAAVETGEPAPAGSMSHAEAVDLVDAQHGDRQVKLALGLRVWLTYSGAASEMVFGGLLSELLSADEIECRWFGGEQEQPA